MFDRNPTSTPPSSDEDNRFEKIINQAPRRKWSAVPKPKTAAKKRIASAATKAFTTSPALTKHSIPAPVKPRQASRVASRQHQDDTEDQEGDARTARKKSRDAPRLQVEAYNPKQNRRKPVVLDDDDEEDTVDALAIDPTSPRDEGISDRSSDEGDDQCDLPKSSLRSAAGLEVNDNAIEEGNLSTLPDLQVIPTRVIVSEAPSQGSVVMYRY
jgi:hypothetical protein